MEKLLKKLTAYCDRGRREQNIVSFIAGSIVSTILIIVAVVILCIYFKMALLWYYIVGAVIAAPTVYLVATGGWEKVAEMWQRTKFNTNK